jgi:hypothetical protein
MVVASEGAFCDNSLHVSALGGTRTTGRNAYVHFGVWGANEPEREIP